MNRAKPTNPVRVLLMNMPQLLFDMIKGIIDTCQDVDVARDSLMQGKMLPAAAAAKADIIIIGDADVSDENCHRVLYRRPRLRILVISQDGRHGFLHELRPHTAALDEISAESLISAIRGTTNIAGREIGPQ